MLALLWLGLFTAYLDRINITIAGPTLMREIGLDPAQFGFVLAAFTGGYALMQFPGGLLADRFGSKRLLVIALVTWSVFTGLTGLATSFAALILVRFLFGLGEGLENGAHFKALADFFDSRERAFAGGVLHTSIALGPAVAAPLAAYFIARLGWEATFALFTGPGLIVAALIWSMFPAVAWTAASRADIEARPRVRWNELFATPAAWAPVAAYGFFNVAYWGLLGFMPTYLSTARHIELKSLGVLSAIPYLCGLVGSLVIGRLGTAFADRRAAFVAIVYVGAGCGLLGAVYVQTLVATVAALSVAAFFLYGSFGLFWALALDRVPPEVRGGFSGVVNFGGQIGGFFAPILVGKLVSATHTFDVAFGCMFAALVVAAVSMIVSARFAVRLPIASPS